MGEDWITGDVAPSAKVRIGLRLDRDILDWLKARGRGYQSRISGLLRGYVEAQQRREAG